MDKISLHLNNLPKVLNDDGIYASPPSAEVIQNSIKFIQGLPTYYQKILDPEDCITATGHGTITIDWYYRKRFISVEIGNTKLGWYSDLPDGSNPSSDGILLQDKPPAAIISALNMIYYRKDI